MRPVISPSMLRGPSRRARRLRRLLRRCVSAALAAVAVLGCLHLLRPPPPPGTVPVVVATHDLPGGTTVSATDVRTDRWPAHLVPRGHLDSPAAVVGRRVGAPMVAGEPLAGHRLLGPGLLTGAARGTAAVFVPVTSTAALTGVVPGAHVQVRTPGSADVLVDDATVLTVVDGAAPDQGAAMAAPETPGAVLALDPVDAGLVAAALGRGDRDGRMLVQPIVTGA